MREGGGPKIEKNEREKKTPKYVPARLPQLVTICPRATIFYRKRGFGPTKSKGSIPQNKIAPDI